MYPQSINVLQENLLLARWAGSRDVLDALSLLVLFPQMPRELVRVKERVAAQMTDEYPPLVGPYKVGPHLGSYSVVS